MSLCLASAVLALGLGVESFTLSWTHSVEKTEWIERWRVEGATLVLDEARVRGSGAGMEPPDGAHLVDGWWIYQAPRRVSGLLLAASGATGRGWQLCTAVGCRDLERWLTLAGRAPALIRVHAGPRCRPTAGDAAVGRAPTASSG